MLGGCGVRFAYSQLDWLVPWYLRDYVTFNAGQREVLDQRLTLRLDWHCRAHLPGYVGLLRDARRLLARERIEAQDLAPFLDQGEAWLDELRVELINDAKVLLAGLSDDQVAELAAAFERRDKEAREEFLGGSTEVRRKAQIARMEKRLRNWFGRLTDEQRALVAGWSRGCSRPPNAGWTSAANGSRVCSTPCRSAASRGCSPSASRPCRRRRPGCRPNIVNRRPTTAN